MVRQGDIWHARLDIPADVRELLGKRVYAKSTQHSDPNTAYEIAQPWISAWKREIAQARQSSAIESAKTLSAQFLASTGIEADYLLLSDVTRFIARRQYGVSEIDWRTSVADHGFDASAALASIGPEASRSLKRITSHQTPFYDAEKIAAFKNENTAGLGAKTVYEYSRTLERFSQTCPGLIAEDFNVQHCQDFILARTTGENAVSPVTLKKDMAGVRTYWSWLVSKDARLRTIKPFDGIIWPERKRVRINPAEPGFTFDPDQTGPRFTPEQVCRLWEAATNEDLRDLIILCAYTGGRRDGVFSLHANAIKLTAEIPHLMLNEKTEAGLRTLPVHPDIIGLVQRRIAQSKTGYLFRHGQNSVEIASSRMTNPMRKLLDTHGYKEGFGFHSLRRTFTGLLENAKIIETHAAKLVGHKIPTLTYGLYAGSIPLTRKQEIMLEAIKYPRRPPTD